MKPVVAAALLLGVIGCTQQQGSDIRSGTITVLVTESHLPLVQQLATEYHSIYPNAVINPYGTTTRGAIVYMVNDSVHCIVVDRRLNGEERAAAEGNLLRVVETEIAHDALVVVVHPHNKLQAISMDELASIMSGKTALWNTMAAARLRGVIGLCLTGKNSGLYEMVARRFFNIQGEIPVAAVASSQDAILEYVAAHPEGLGIVSFALWKDTTSAIVQRWKRNVRLLDFQVKDNQGLPTTVGVNQQNIYDRVYPLTYSLYIYTSEKKAGTAQGFSAFIAGDVGQRVFQYAGLVPKTMPYRTIQLTQD
jgi:phosphate transport system substrate-binding protein